jgi:hypothetical protein
MSLDTGGVHQAIAAVRAAAGQLLACDLTALPDAVLLDLLRELRPVVCQVQAAESRLIGVVHRRGAVSRDGAVSTSAWLRNRLHYDDAPARVRAAVTVDRLPELAQAFAAGEVSPAHVAVIATVARDLTDEALAGGAAGLLVEQARTLAPARFTQTAVQLRDRLDPQAADRRRRERLERRWLYADRTFDGAVSLNGMLDPEAGELLLATLGALMPPPKPGDDRSAATRRADALLDLCRLAANHAPTAGGEKPHVLITVDWETLRDDLTQRLTSTDLTQRLTPTDPTQRLTPPTLTRLNLPARPRPGPDTIRGSDGATTTHPHGLTDASKHTDATGQPITGSGTLGPGAFAVGTLQKGTLGKGAVGKGATLGSGWPIGVETVRRLACDAGIIPMLLGSASEPLDVGRLSRTAPPALRRALVYRDGGCRFPHCGRPPEWTDAHHIVHWLLGGDTSLTNCCLLCRAHHVKVHEQGWRLNLDPTTGTITVHYPNGQLFDTSHPRGPVRLRGNPAAATHRKPYEC